MWYRSQLPWVTGSVSRIGHRVPFDSRTATHGTPHMTAKGIIYLGFEEPSKTGKPGFRLSIWHGRTAELLGEKWLPIEGSIMAMAVAGENYRLVVRYPILVPWDPVVGFQRTKPAHQLIVYEVSPEFQVRLVREHVVTPPDAFWAVDSQCRWAISTKQRYGRGLYEFWLHELTSDRKIRIAEKVGSTGDSLVIAPDESEVMLSVSYNRFAAFSLKTGHRLRPKEHYGKPIAYDPAGERILTYHHGFKSEYSRIINRWNGKELDDVPASWSAVFRPDGKQLIGRESYSGSPCFIYDLVKKRTVINTKTDDMMSYSPDGKYILTTAGGRIQLIDAKTTEPVPAPTPIIRRAIPQPDQPGVVWGLENSQWREWNLNTGRVGPVLGTLPARRVNTELDCSFSSDGR
ncbi:MAG: WD40 repeat domain-containing protein, partial [Gemmataceae bacterium]